MYILYDDASLKNKPNQAPSANIRGDCVCDTDKFHEIYFIWIYDDSDRNMFQMNLWFLYGSVKMRWLYLKREKKKQNYYFIGILHKFKISFSTNILKLQVFTVSFFIIKRSAMRWLRVYKIIGVGFAGYFLYIYISTINAFLFGWLRINIR